MSSQPNDPAREQRLRAARAIMFMMRDQFTYDRGMGKPLGEMNTEARDTLAADLAHYVETGTVPKRSK